MRELGANFRPEFINRLDEIIMFKPLTKSDLKGIVNLLLKDINERLTDRELTVKLTEDAERYIIENGFDPVYGARPLKRYIQKTVETLAAKLILKGDVSAGESIVIMYDERGLYAAGHKN